jgi:hypothetical protein
LIPSKEAIHLEQILVFGFLLHRHTFIGSNAGPWESAFVEFDETVLKEERSSCVQVSDNEKWELNAPARPRCRPHGPGPHICAHSPNSSGRCLGTGPGMENKLNVHQQRLSQLNYLHLLPCRSQLRPRLILVDLPGQSKVVDVNDILSLEPGCQVVRLHIPMDVASSVESAISLKRSQNLAIF